jgi:mannose-6-phosphate isomerase-like protein (cupin superfamily)
VDGVLLGPDEGEWLEGTTRRHRILCELPALEVLDLRFGPEFEGVDLHTHDDHTDCFYVLEGVAEFAVGGEVLSAGPGSFVAAPPGTLHGFRNAGDSDLRVINVHAPSAGFAARLRTR